VIGGRRIGLGREIDLAEASWRADAGVSVERTGGALLVRSSAADSRSLHLSRWLLAPRRHPLHLELEAHGELRAGAGAAVGLVVDGKWKGEAPWPSRSTAPVPAGAPVGVRISVAPGAELLVRRLAVRFVESSWSLADRPDASRRVAVVTPTYPSSADPYSCGFVRSRVREYQRRGLEPLVVCASPIHRFQCAYELDGVPVLRGDLAQLRRLLDERGFAAILLHFFHERYALALQRSLRNARTRTVLFCHGAETLFRELASADRPYFTPPGEPETPAWWRDRQHAIELFDTLPNVHWVFVSRWQQALSERHLGRPFASAEVVTNFISPELFPFREKPPELRRRVFFLRRFSDERHYSIDVAVETVLALSSRPGFRELEFDFFGDGERYEPLVAPLRRFPNVHLHRTFLEQSRIAEAHARCGIALFPARFDNTGVSSCEAASSGLAVLTSAAGAHRELLPDDLGLLARDDEPREYAAMIERLVARPDEWERARRRQAEHVRASCSYALTVEREIALVREEAPRARARPAPPAAGRRAALTVVVPVSGPSPALERCLASLANVADGSRLEILVAIAGEDGAAARTPRQLAGSLPGTVRLLEGANPRRGAMLAAGLAAATGAYFRVVDADEWVDPLELARLLESLAADDADLVLAGGAEEEDGAEPLRRVSCYDSLTPGRLYAPEVLADATCGFRSWGPLPSLSCYRTDALRAAQVAIPAGADEVRLRLAVQAVGAARQVRYVDRDVRRGPPLTASAASFEAQAEDLVGACEILAAASFAAAPRTCALRSLVVPATVALERRLADHRERDALRERLKAFPFLELPPPEPPAGALSPLVGLLRSAWRECLPYAYTEFDRPGAAGYLRSAAKHLVPLRAWNAARRALVTWRGARDDVRRE
jgi:glycosyltransferase involved in cell wall biosynthesis